MQIASRSRSHIGLDLTGRTLRAVQLAGRPGAWRLGAAVQLTRADPDEPLSRRDLSRLLDVLERRGFTGRRLVLGLDGPDLAIENIELPPRTSGAPVEILARNELAQSMRCEASTIESVAWDLPPEAGARKGAPLMAVACRHQAANAILDAVEGAGFEVEALDVRPLAAARAALEAMGRTPGMVVLVDLDWQRAQLIVALGGGIVHLRRIDDAGLARLHEALQKGLRVEPDEAELLIREPPGSGEGRLAPELASIIDAHWERLAEEVRLSLSYLEHRHPGVEIGRVAIFGEGAEHPGVLETLQRVLELTPTRLSPGDLLSEGSVDAGSGMLVATGLATWGRDREAPAANLIPAARRHRACLRSRVRTWSVVTAAYAAIVALGVFLALMGREDTSATQQAIDALAADAERLQEDIRFLGSSIAAQATLLQAHRSLQADPDWSLLLALVASRVDDDVALTGIQLAPRRADRSAEEDPPDAAAPASPGAAAYELVLTGRAPSQGRVTDFVLDLEGLGVFDSVAILDAQRDSESAAEESGVRFVILCLLVEREEATGEEGTA